MILVACIAANVPFLSQRYLLVGPFAGPRKPFWLRLFELLLMYLAVGATALMLERRTGQIAAQGWEFYAVTAALFITLAFPGFVYRYLLRRPGAGAA